MSVSSATSRIVYTGNNSLVTAYAVPFYFEENAHLNAIAKTAAGIETVVTLTNHAGAGDPNGGTVRTAVAVPATSTLTIYREVPFTQTTSYAENDAFPAESHERALDKLTTITQQLERRITNCIRGTEATPLSPIPSPTGTQQFVLSAASNQPPSWQELPVLATGPVVATGSTQARFISDRFADVVNVKDFGAVGDGVTDDTAAIQAACNACAAVGGGIVFLKPTGAPYRTTDTIALGNGVVLVGTPAQTFAGANATVAQWAAAGSWIRPENPITPAIRLQGHGSAAIGLNFIHNQPIPAGGSWSPNVYGYCIRQEISHAKIRDIMIVNGFNGIELAYTPTSGGGTAVNWSNIIVSAFGTRLRTSNVNDTIHWSDIHCRNLYYSSDSRVVDYIRANTIGWDCGYTDNPMIDGLEFFEDSTAILLRNETCLGNTHSLYNGTLNNVQFNLPQKSIVLADTSVVAWANWGTVVAQQGNAFGRTWGDRMFDLNSNNIDFIFDTLRVNDAGGEIMRLGNGVGGKCRIANLDVLNYSTVAGGQVGFNLAASARLALNNYRVVKPAGAGGRFAGAGVDLVTTAQYASISVFNRFFEADVTCNGAYQDWSTDFFSTPGVAQAHQIRLKGQIEVFTPVAASSFAVRLSGISNAIVSGLSGATAGFVSFDTGWLDISEAEIASLANLGRFQVNGTSTLRLRNGSVEIGLR